MTRRIGRRTWAITATATAAAAALAQTPTAPAPKPAPPPSTPIEAQRANIVRNRETLARFPLDRSIEPVMRFEP